LDELPNVSADHPKSQILTFPSLSSKRFSGFGELKMGKING